MSARDEGAVGAMTQPDDRLDLLSVFWKHDGARCRPEVNERVRLVGQQIGGFGEQRAAAGGGAKIREKSWLHGGRVYFSRPSTLLRVVQSEVEGRLVCI